MLTLLILCYKQPRNDIVVYLEPLIEDLKTLRNEGIEVFDVYYREKFTMSAIQIWNINDFSIYGNLSGDVIKKTTLLSNL